MTDQIKLSGKDTQAPDSISLDIQNKLTKNIAVLFTDMKGSSAFYKTHGNVAGRSMIQKLNDMLFPFIKAYNGTVVKTIGDSIMAYFLTPKEALWAAVAMQKNLKTYNRDHGPSDHMLVRIVINYGPGIVEEKDVFGDVVNVAGKLISCCDAMQIIVTESVHREAKNTQEIAFTPYRDQRTREQIADTNVYLVDWEKIKGTNDTDSIYLLSLISEAATGGARSTEGIDNALPIIKQAANKVINTQEAELNAFFSDASVCLATAQKAILKHLILSSGEELPNIFKIGLHAIDESDMGDWKSPDIFNEVAGARDKAEPFEIILTSRFYNDLTGDFKNACMPHKNSPDTRKPLYLFQGEKLKKQKTVFTSLFPDKGVDLHKEFCCYCGATQHRTNRCPSKIISKTTHYLEKLGYTSLYRMREIFQKNFQEIVSPLKKGSEEDRFEMLFKEDKDDPYSLAFFSFYEVSEIFQLRAVHQLGPDKAVEKASSRSKTGALIMGEDCLRVSKFEEAGEWFDKAVKEQPNDYRPHLSLGMLYLEESDPQRAIFYFNQALTFPMGNIRKCHIYLLIARIHEASGALPEAQKEIEKAVVLAPDWKDARYYHAVILVKSGQVESAIAIFKKLLEQSPRYYLMVSLDPQLNVAKNAIIAFLNRELTDIRSRAEKSFVNIKRTIEEDGRWLSPEDEDFQKVFELFQKASATVQEESIFGLTDIPAHEISVNLLMQHAFAGRIHDLRSKIFEFKKIAAFNSKYLAAFPYKNLLTDKDLKLNRDFEALLENAQGAVSMPPPQSFQRAKALIEMLSKESRKLTSTRNRLEIKKKSYFVLECSAKVTGFFLAVTIVTTLLFTFVLILYQGYDNSLASITKTRLVNFMKFGAIAGLFAGVFGAVLWFRKNFGKMRKKIES